MTIVVQIDSSNAANDIRRDFNERCFILLAKKNPSVSFVFVSDTPFLKSFEAIQNITYLTIGPRLRNSLFNHYWYQHKLSKILKKLNANYFFSSTNHCNHKTNTAQAIYLETLLSSRDNKKKNLLKASHIIVPNDYIKLNASLLMPAITEKLLVCYSGIEKKVAAAIEIKENIKKTYTGDKDFFFFDFEDTTDKKLLLVLKAFSLFKKWQQSKMKLLLAVDSIKIQSVETICSNYKYKEDVVIVSSQSKETLDFLIGSAYASIFMPNQHKIPLNVHTALSYEVPVILPETAFYRANFGEAILYSEENETSISNGMILLYKDERARNQFIQKGKELSADRTWENCAHSVWESIINKKKI